MTFFPSFFFFEYTELVNWDIVLFLEGPLRLYCSIFFYYCVFFKQYHLLGVTWDFSGLMCCFNVFVLRINNSIMFNNIILYLNRQCFFSLKMSLYYYKQNNTIYSIFSNKGETTVHIYLFNIT